MLRSNTSDRKAQSLNALSNFAPATTANSSCYTSKAESYPKSPPCSNNFWSFQRKRQRDLGMFLLGVLLVTFLLVVTTLGGAIKNESQRNFDGSIKYSHASHEGLRMSARKSAAFSAAPEEEGMATSLTSMDVESVNAADGGSSTLGSEMLASMEKNLNNIDSKEGPGKIERMLAHSGDVSLKSPPGKADEIADQIINMVESPGYVEDRRSENSQFRDFTYNYNDYQSEGQKKKIHLKLRVPSTEFHSIINKIQLLVEKDKIISVSTKSRDVTDEYIDATARVDTLAASRNALKTLLESANNIKDVMTVKNELNRLTEQIESHKRRALYLQKQASLSELNVDIQEGTKKRDDDDNNHSRWDPTKPMYLASSHLFSLVSVACDTFIYVSVWAVPCVILFVLARMFFFCKKSQMQK